MGPQPGSGAPWQPPRDEDLTWFVAPRKLASNRRPLEFTLEVDAFCFGITRALESLEFPLTEVRPRLLEGRLYLAVAPSAQAERDLPRRLRNVQDLSFRYTKDIKGFWEAQVRSKIEEYNRWIANYANAAGSPAELAEGVRQLRRVRGNQWFNVCRPVLAPTVITQRRLDDARRPRGHNSDEAGSLLKGANQGLAAAGEALAMLDRGKAVMFSSLSEVGARLARAGCLVGPDDVFWLEWMEVRKTLENNVDNRALVAERKAEASRSSRGEMPDSLGPALPQEAPRMYLIREMMALLD